MSFGRDNTLVSNAREAAHLLDKSCLSSSQSGTFVLH